MGQTIALIHMDIESRTLSPLLDRVGFFASLPNSVQETLWLKSQQADFIPFSATINDNTFEVVIGSTPSGNYFAVFTLLEEKTLKSLFDIESTMRTQQLKIFELAKSRHMTTESVTEALENICESIAQLIDVDRVGIWLFNDEMTKLEAQNIYDKRYDSHVYGEILSRLLYPTYFDAFENARAVAIHDVAQDPRVKELYPHYFSAMGGIQSILDAPIILSTGVGGVLCCETVGRRTWTELDQTLAGTLADMVAFLFERLHRLETEEEIQKLAYVDQLTGLPNQNAFFNQVSKDIEEFTNGKFIYLNIDQFSTIQEVLGFDGGREVLQETATRLAKQFQDPSSVARIGMDHFVLFLHPSEIPTYVEKLLALKKPMIINGEEVYITYSFGAARYPEHGESPEACLQSAQMALSYGKKVGSRSVTSVFNPYMRELSETTLHTEMNLRKGLDMEEFCLFLQPQVDCETETTQGFEALIRWNHPEKGLISPFEFISHAESTGLILPIGEWVIRTACQQLMMWNQSGQQTTISVNISPRHFLHEKLIPFLQMCLDTYDFYPEQLVIEITEAVAMGDYIAAQEQMVQLKKLGFHVSIDDFGTGFSAFVYLQHFAINEIKIDRRFIRDVHENEKSLGIVKTILELGKILELRVVVEGVETEEQLIALRAIGCRVIQGFYYARPMPMEEATDWMRINC